MVPRGCEETIFVTRFHRLREPSYIWEEEEKGSCRRHQIREREPGRRLPRQPCSTAFNLSTRLTWPVENGLPLVLPTLTPSSHAPYVKMDTVQGRKGSSQKIKVLKTKSSKVNTLSHRISAPLQTLPEECFYFNHTDSDADSPKWWNG